MTTSKNSQNREKFYTIFTLGNRNFCKKSIELTTRLECCLRGKTMNSTYRISLILGFATVLAGLTPVVHAQVPPTQQPAPVPKQNSLSAVDLYNSGVDKLNSRN